ncbi:MAG: hypothetical protein AMJ56_09455 [Anaerolineae bacterium SG8_19]|nr:MAG: hypothetical protein AMJ56_09455 [Anaerolineae bacterium SG8_19]
MVLANRLRRIGAVCVDGVLSPMLALEFSPQLEYLTKLNLMISPGFEDVTANTPTRVKPRTLFMLVRLQIRPLCYWFMRVWTLLELLSP